MEDRGWWMEDGWRMDGGWIEDGWRMVDGGWRMVDGGWWMEDGCMEEGWMEVRAGGWGEWGWHSGAVSSNGPFPGWPCGSARPPAPLSRCCLPLSGLHRVSWIPRCQRREGWQGKDGSAPGQARVFWPPCLAVSSSACPGHISPSGLPTLLSRMDDLNLAAIRRGSRVSPGAPDGPGG